MGRPDVSLEIRMCRGGSLVGYVAAYCWLVMWQLTAEMWWFIGWKCGSLLGRCGGLLVGNVAGYLGDVVAHWLEIWQLIGDMWWLIGW